MRKQQHVQQEVSVWSLGMNAILQASSEHVDIHAISHFLQAHDHLCPCILVVLVARIALLSEHVCHSLQQRHCDLRVAHFDVGFRRMWRPLQVGQKVPRDFDVGS